MDRPADLFDRDREWADLGQFASSGQRGLQIGMVYGRRRQGKSFLLRRLVAAQGGIYCLALEEQRRPALERFGRCVAEALGLPAMLRFDDWTQALRVALGLDQPGGGRLVVLDEFPYLLHGAPELASVIQALYDDSRHDPAAPAAHLVLCGSAFTIMSELLSGARPLRGRSRLDLVVSPFDYRMAREFWGIADQEVALRLHAVLGGTPGYRDLTDSVPHSMVELDRWLVGHVLNPAHALFGETDYLLREDPTITDRALYQSVLAVIASGQTTPGGIAAALGRDARSLWHPLEVLLAGGFIRRSEDILTQRRPIYAVADPIIRFGMLIIRPRQAMYEERRAPTAWEASREAFATRVLGPHFEELAREWTRRFAAATTLGGPVGIVGQTVLNDPAGRATYELDVIAFADGDQLHAKRAIIRAIGEAKATNRTRSIGDLDRLERIQALLAQRGHDATQARLLLFSRTGFTRELLDAARTRGDVELIDLARLYTGD